MNVLRYDPYSDPDLAYLCKVELDDLLARADFVDGHVPLTAETQGMLNAGSLALMKPTAYLISASDTGVFDGNALAEALAEKFGVEFKIVEHDINTVISYSNLVIGMFSNALIEASILGAPIIRILKDLKIPDPLEDQQVGKVVTSLEALDEQLIKYI